ncbi:hypothetical protein Ple7327_1816 [Pleurocapsa sp. PCC 7327]|nr:hypothetical protein Ple7327_1816 [Pleurocapsa sp. PCC 7327]
MSDRFLIPMNKGKLLQASQVNIMIQVKRQFQSFEEYLVYAN